MLPDKSEMIVDMYQRKSNNCNGLIVNGKYRAAKAQLLTPTDDSSLQLSGIFATPFIASTIDLDDELLSPPVYKRCRSEVLESQWDVIESSSHAQNTINPIRSIVDVLSIEPNPEKPLIRLNIGDPSVSGVLPTHPNVAQAVADALMSGKYNGYGPAVGFQEVRQALAEYVSLPDTPVSADDIVLTSGCSHALQLAIEALANAGDNILVPRPGFPLYSTLMHPHGVKEKFYDLLAERNWEADVDQMDKLIDKKTVAIIINNPNNPTGAVYSREHLEKILRLAERHHVPIIADEIYGNMIYGGATFHPMASLRPKVPILTCDGISKRFLVPGWRLGWLIIHDVNGAFKKVRQGIKQLSQKIVGPCSLMQGALPAILKNTPESFFQNTRDILSENARVVYENLKDVRGLSPVKSQGAMYIMIGLDTRCFPEFPTELDFVKALLSEDSVYCLPGTAFFYPGAFRIVLTNRKDQMVEACSRIRDFCDRHYVPVDL